jgi:hypothetical protein
LPGTPWIPAPNPQQTVLSASDVAAPSLSPHDSKPDSSSSAPLNADGPTEAIAVDDVSSVLSWLEAASDADNSALCLQLIRGWAAAAPACAAVWVERLTEGGFRREAMESVAIAWARQDVVGAALWAAQLPSEEDSQLLLSQVATEAIRQQPAEAVAIARELPPSLVRDHLLSQAAAEWAARAPLEAIAWVSTIDDEVIHAQVASAVAISWSERDPVAAARFALDVLPQGRAREDAWIGIVQRWVQSDPRAASRWVANFPPGALREVAIETMAQLRPR